MVSVRLVGSRKTQSFRAPSCASPGAVRRGDPEWRCSLARRLCRVPGPRGSGLSILLGAVRLLPSRTATWRAARAIMAGSRHTAGVIAEVSAETMIYLAENGIDPTRFTARATSGSSGLPLRAVFVGRMVPYKMPDALVEAAAPLMAEGKLLKVPIGPRDAVVADSMQLLSASWRAPRNLVLLARQRAPGPRRCSRGQEKPPKCDRSMTGCSVNVRPGPRPSAERSPHDATCGT